jgi:CheY-like chemotaxis protein
MQMPLREGFGMGKRILLVEDNAEFRQVFIHALGLALAAEELDFTFVESGSMAEARERLRNDGLDLVREIKDGSPDGIPTLVLTAGLDHSVAARAVEAGAQGAQSKAVSMPETVAAVKRLTGHQER